MKIRNEKTAAIAWKSVIYGVISAVGIVILLSMVAAVVMGKGSVPEERIGLMSAVIVFVAVFIASIVASIGKNTGILVQIGCVFSAIVLLMFSLNFLLLDGELHGALMNIFAAIAGALFAVVIRVRTGKNKAIRKMRVS